MPASNKASTRKGIDFLNHCSSIPLIGSRTNLTQKKVAYSDTGNSAINLGVADKLKFYDDS
jgi:hypothetical protein